MIMKKNKNEGNDVEEKVSSAESDDNRSDDRVKVTKSVFQVSREEREKQRQEELRKQEELEKELARREKEKQEAYERRILEEKKELIRLKQGLIEESETIHEEHEEAIKLSFWKKISNFFYHNKWWLGIGLVIVLIFAYLIHSCITKPRPDITVLVIATDASIGTSEGLQRYVESFTPDNNGNGKKLCSLYYIERYKDGYSNYVTGSDTKLVTQLQSADSLIVFAGNEFKSMADTESIFMDLGEIFPDDPEIFGYYFYLKDTPFAERIGIDPELVPDDLYIAIRKPQKLLYSKESEMQEAYDRDVQVFIDIVNDLRGTEQE